MKNYLKVFMINLTTLTLLALPMAVAKPTQADVIAPLSRSSGDTVAVRLYNPSDITVTGSVNGQNYSLPAKNVEEFTVTGDTVAVVPSTDSENNKLPDPVVDVEQSKNGMIASPVLLSLEDLAATGTQVGPMGDTLSFLSGADGATIDVYSFENGVTSAATRYTVAPDDMLSVPLSLSGTLCVDIISGSGAAVASKRSSLDDIQYWRLGAAEASPRVISRVKQAFDDPEAKYQFQPWEIRWMWANHGEELAQAHWDGPAASIFGTYQAMIDFFLEATDGVKVLGNPEITSEVWKGNKNKITYKGGKPKDIPSWNKGAVTNGVVPFGPVMDEQRMDDCFSIYQKVLIDLVSKNQDKYSTISWKKR